MWPRTGVKVHVPEAITIDRDRSMSTVSVVVLPERISNGVVVFSSPDGTENVTVVPLVSWPVALLTTIRICVYLPGANRAFASSSEMFTRDAKSTVVRASVTLCQPTSSAFPASWAQTSVKVTPTCAQSTTALVRFVDRMHPAGRALELGCGEGRDAIFLARRGLQVTAIDASSSALSRARERAREEGVRVRFSRGDMTGRQPFRSGTFDLVASIDAFHLATGSRDRARHFREAHRLLKPGGLYFFCNHTARRPRISAGRGRDTIWVDAPDGGREILVP